MNFLREGESGWVPMEIEVATALRNWVHTSSLCLCIFVLMLYVCHIVTLSSQYQFGHTSLAAFTELLTLQTSVLIHQWSHGECRALWRLIRVRYLVLNYGLSIRIKGLIAVLITTCQWHIPFCKMQQAQEGTHFCRMPQKLHASEQMPYPFPLHF